MIIKLYRKSSSNKITNKYNILYNRVLKINLINPEVWIVKSIKLIENDIKLSLD